MNDLRTGAQALKISVCARAEVDLHGHQGITHLLSIDDPGMPTPTPSWLEGPHWHVVFQDAQSEADAQRLNAIPPRVEHIQQVLMYAGECIQASRSGPAHLLVHCTAGGSRSPAVAYVIWCMVFGFGREPEALQRVLSDRPNVLPNHQVVRLADELLHRKGRMIAALKPLEQEMSQAVDSWLRKMKRA